MGNGFWLEKMVRESRHSLNPKNAIGECDLKKLVYSVMFGQEEKFIAMWVEVMIRKVRPNGRYFIPDYFEVQKNVRTSLGSRKSFCEISPAEKGVVVWYLTGRVMDGIYDKGYFEWGKKNYEILKSNLRLYILNKRGMGARIAFSRDYPFLFYPFYEPNVHPNHLIALNMTEDLIFEVESVVEC